MDWIQELAQSEDLQSTLTVFLNQYGTSGLESAMRLYSSMHREYFCRTKASVTRIKITDMYYLKIKSHSITVYTEHDVYHKYGSLTTEQKLLAPYGFIKCSQSCLVSLDKIQSIRNNTITLINLTQLHMSQRYAPKVLAAFNHNRFTR